MRIPKHVQESDQLFGNNWNAHKHWKKLREKHENNDKARAAGRTVVNTPEPWEDKTLECQGINIDKAIYDLRYDLAFGKITEEEFNERMKQFEVE